MTQPAPHYQPYQPLPPAMGVMAPPKPTGGGLTSLIAGILALVVAGLVVGGSFAPVTNYRNSYEADGDVTVYDTTVGWWGYSDNGSTNPMEDESSLYGLGLVLVAVLVVLGAVFAFVASRSRASGPTTGGRSLISAGVGVLAGLMVVQALSVLEQASSYNDRELEAGESLDFSAGLGLILPLSALALGLVALVLAHVGQRQRAFRVEPNTPRMGFPAPYGYQGGPAAPGVPAVVGAQVAAASPAAAAPPTATPSDEEDNSGETTQVVSNATASGTAPAPDSVSAALSGEAPAAPTPPAPEPPAPIAPPAPVTPPAPVAPVVPAAPAAPEPPATPISSDSGASPASAEPTPPTAAAPAPNQPATPTGPTATATPAPSQPAPSADAASPATTGTAPAGPPPAAAPSAPTPPTATTPAPNQPAPPAGPAATDAPAAADAPAPGQPAPLAGLPVAPPAPELADEADKNEK